MVTGPRFIYTGKMAAERPKFEVPEFLGFGHGRCAKVGDPDDFTETSTRRDGIAARERAKAVCRSCPFEEECLAWAESSGQDGVWGGVWLKGGKPANKREEVARRAAA